MSSSAVDWAQSTDKLTDRDRDPKGGGKERLYCIRTPHILMGFDVHSNLLRLIRDRGG